MADVSGLEPPQLLRWSEQCCPISGVPSIVGCPVLGTQLASNRTVPPPALLSIPSIFSFVHSFQLSTPENRDCLVLSPPPGLLTQPFALVAEAWRGSLFAGLAQCPGKAVQARPPRGHASVGLVVVPIWPPSLCLLSSAPYPPVLLTGPKDSESFWEGSLEESGILPTWTQLCYVTLYQSLELPGPRWP